MSRYAGSDYPRDRRERSPPRFPDRRPSTTYNDPPRAPRPRELRDAPPLGRTFREPRDFPPRDVEPPRQRRSSRDGPLTPASTYPEPPPAFRGGFGRGRGRGDSEFRGGRGGRRHPDERDLFRRERSPPPPRWTRDSSRDDREPERRDDRRFDRRDDTRRPEWADRERELDRGRRDLPPQRLDGRPSNDSLASGPAQSSAAPHVNPDRLALIEDGGVDPATRRTSMTQPPTPVVRETRRDQPEIPAYLNGRAETTNNRYGSRGSSPPTQPPPVPAFTLSFAPSAQNAAPTPSVKPTIDAKQPAGQVAPASPSSEQPQRPEAATADAILPPPSTAPKALDPISQAEKPPISEPSPAAPRAPKALGNEPTEAPINRLQGVRSWENLTPSKPSIPASHKPENAQVARLPSNPQSPTITQSNIPGPAQPLPLTWQQTPRLGDFAAPTGPKAKRASSTQASGSPRHPFTSPHSDGQAITHFSAPLPRSRTPPLSAPSGPRNRAVSASPKAPHAAIPTAPKADRLPPSAPRGPDRGMIAPGRGPERTSALGGRLPPTAPRAQQWNQWRRAGPPSPAEKLVPAKRDSTGEDKARQSYQGPSNASAGQQASSDVRNAWNGEPRQAAQTAGRIMPSNAETEADKMDIDHASGPAKAGPFFGHSAKQSFFGKPVEAADDDPDLSDAADETMSTTDEDEIEFEDLALFEAKFERQRRELEARLVDLSSREYRATSPLESIARLSRVSMKNVKRFKEREPEMDVDEPRSTNDHLMPPATHSSESDEGPDLLTPKGEDNASVVIQEADDAGAIVRRIRRPTPEVITLPYLTKAPQMPFNESEAFRENVRRQEDTREAMLAAIDDMVVDQEDLEEQIESQFAGIYRQWRDECEDLDREHEELERMERQLSQEPGPEPEITATTPINPGVEGRRLHKFSSEYEIEQVLKQSEETARIEQEKAEREAKKVQADMEKEAMIPDQMPEDDFQRTLFIDNNRLRDPENLTVVFAYQPPKDDFTEQENQIFSAAFKETPKKWSEIASLLPGRAAKDCIRHYYSTKWDNCYKDGKNKRNKAGKRGRGGKAPMRGKGTSAMADMARGEDLQTVNMSDSGRPKRAAAPTTFGERELDSKASLLGQSPAKRPGAGSKQDGQGEAGAEKPAKRRKAVGEKPGRKPKGTQPLAQLAAAPTLSPDNRNMQHGQVKDDFNRTQALEDASLLAGLQSGLAGMHPESHAIYMTEGYLQHRPPEDPERLKPAGPSQPSKPSPSSYWSVPEQSDFIKYIGYFGTDFGAIAAHMGTKTQTMIKNHYQRQIDGGNRPEMEEAAMAANVRRERGEEMGAPPTPTPITKRKYDNPQSNVQRPLAPHADPMDMDESGPTPRGAPSKLASPAQYQMQPRFGASAAQIAAAQQQPKRVAPSPAPPPEPTSTPQMAASAPARSFHTPLGTRLSMFPESRQEGRASLQAAASFRPSQHGTPAGQPAQSSRSVQEAQDPQYIRSLLEEQKRAMRVQGHYQDQEQFHHRGSLQQHMSRSPGMQPAQVHPERKPAMEARASTPPMPFFSAKAPTTSAGRKALESPGAYSFDPMRFASSRQSMLSPPPRREEQRPSTVPTVSALQTPPVPASVPEPPKRSNLLSILNSDADEPRAAKRSSIHEPIPQAVIPRGISPAQHGAASVPPPFSGASQSRLGTFEPSSMGQSPFHRVSVSQMPAPAPSPAPAGLKQEPHSAGGSGIASGIPPKQDWASRMGGQGGQAAPPNPPPAFERDVRPYYSHRSSMMGQLNGPGGANPSPPPHPIIQHSRTPSLSGQGPAQPPSVDSRGYMSNQQPGAASGSNPGVALQPSPYGPQSHTPFSQPPPPASQAASHAHHAHNPPMGGGFPPMHQRGLSRDEHLRQEQAFREREREEREWRLRQEEQDAERRRVEAQQLAQRQHEQERHYSRGGGGGGGGGGVPPGQPPMQPPFGGGASFEQGGPPRLGAMGGMREQAKREAEFVMQQEAERMRQHPMLREREREREREQAEEARRRHDQAFLPGARRTPLGGGGGFGAPSLPGPGRR